MWFLGSHRSHRSRGSHGFLLWVGNLTEALRIVVFRLTQITQIFLLMVENLTEDGGVVWGCCLITPSALITPIYQSSHRFNEIQQKDYLWEFVLICGRKKTIIF